MTGGPAPGNPVPGGPPPADPPGPREEWHERGSGGLPDEAGPQGGFGPWETYENGEGYGWTGGYGVVPGQGWSQFFDDPGQPYDEGQPGDAGQPAVGYATGPAAPGPAATGPAAPGPAPAPARDGMPDHPESYRAPPPGAAPPAAGQRAAGGAHAQGGGRPPGGMRPAGAPPASPGASAAYGTVAPDMRTPYAGVSDVEAPDAGAPDAGAPDTGAPDAGAPDTGAPDAGAPDTGAPDTGVPPEHGERPEWQAESADSLTADLLLRGRHAAPPPGWRRALYQVTGGLVRAPQSHADRRRQDLVQRARTPVAGGHHRVAVLSLKGGVGKTTTTVGLGSTLASLRGDRVIAVDANPDRGTLCDKLRLETAATVRDLLNEEDQIQRYADVRAYTTQAPSGLEVLASDRDPTVSVAFSAEDYEDVARVLEHYYSVSITDCGTGLLHSAMAGVLHLADQIVLVSSPSVDGARSASATLDWLAAHRYGDLVRGAVVVLSAIRPRSKSAVDLIRLEQHFAARCRAVVRVPYDAHLEEGAEVDLARLSRATADAYLILAAEVGDGFSWPGR
jgi:MinD-like ATPase involved in chromosome partitioning or flagellar assembly